MGATEVLRKDHQLLREKLEFLEAAMQVAPEAQFALREMCWSLARVLDEHIKREEQVLAPYGNRIAALTQYHLAQDHADQRVVLRDVNALLLGGIKTPVSRVMPPLSHLIDELREHMEEEEREVFPVVDRVASEQPQAPPAAPAAPVMTQAMTVNHVLKVHPKAREIFRQFHIDPESDGCHCLDELRWRRGIDVEQLLSALSHPAADPSAVN
jgi:iron-sulfur cluster repair protein YtfE (RIC family)